MKVIACLSMLETAAQRLCVRERRMQVLEVDLHKGFTSTQFGWLADVLVWRPCIGRVSVDGRMQAWQHAVTSGQRS